MKSVIVWMIFILLVVMTGPILARTPDQSPARPPSVEVAGPSDMGPLYSRSRAEKADYILLNDDFESGPSGWTSHDLTTTETHWHTSDFNAANLDPGQPGNHAWWCGADIPNCIGFPEDETGGYGGNWDDRLEWNGGVPEPSQLVAVTLAAVLNTELEPGYDYLYLEIWQNDDWVVLDMFNGNNLGLEYSSPAWDYYSDDAGNQNLLRWRVDSDPAGDAEDCWFPNDGAAQIDNIEVRFDGVLQGSIETCEPGDPSSWIAVPIPGVGDFAQLWSDAWDADPCADNANQTHRWVFIDDGMVEPGTGGSTGEPGFDYFEDNWVVNATGGLLGPGNSLWNEVRSPVIEWPEGMNGGKVAFDIYIHFPYPGGPISPGISGSYRIRSTDDQDADPELNPELWTEWYDMISYFLYGEPRNSRHELDVSQFLIPGCRRVQIALGVKQIGVFNVSSAGATPAPYFDNVLVKSYDDEFLITVHQMDLAQDAFPTTFGLAPSADHTVSFHSARNLAGYQDPPVFQEFLKFTVTPLTGDQPSEVFMHYRHQRNPIYDEFRDVGLDSEGSIACEVVDEIFSPDDWKAVFPVGNYFFPGDVVHYYFEVTGTSQNAISPPDITGFDDFTPGSPYHEWFTWRALPSLNAEGSVPPVLVWNDSGAIGEANNWPEAMIATGLYPGVGFDTYRTTAPGHNQENGLGIVPAGVLDFYRTIVYCGGNYSYEPLEYQDILRIDQFLSLGDKSFVISGNHTVSGLDQEGTGEGAALLTTWFGVQSAGNDVGLFTGTVNQSVSVLPGNGVFDDGDHWVVDGNCPFDKNFDAVTPVPGEAVSLADFLPVGDPPYTAVSQFTRQDVGGITFVIPYDLNFIEEWPMSAILEDIFIALEYGPVPCFLQTCDFSVGDGTVQASWLVSGQAQTEDFRLEAAGPDGPRVIPHLRSAADRFTALDDSPLLQAGGTFAYTLYYRGGSENWDPIHEAEVKVGGSVPAVTRLVGAAPNPFNPQTEIAFSLAKKQMVNVSVYDLQGRQITNLVSDNRDAGHYTVVWKGTDATGRRAASGTYFVQMKTASKVESKKIMLVK